jgi:hypothetical protein
MNLGNATEKNNWRDDLIRQEGEWNPWYKWISAMVFAIQVFMKSHGYSGLSFADFRSHCCFLHELCAIRATQFWKTIFPCYGLATSQTISDLSSLSTP